MRPVCTDPSVALRTEHLHLPLSIATQNTGVCMKLSTLFSSFMIYFSKSRVDFCANETEVITGYEDRTVRRFGFSLVKFVCALKKRNRYTGVLSSTN
jgi:hypothetical protein